jgi:hypothetical protein
MPCDQYGEQVVKSYQGNVASQYDCDGTFCCGRWVGG